MDHGDMGGSEPMCSMNVSYTPPASCAPLSIYQPAQPQKQMLFTWDTTNLCIVFPSWRVTGTFSLIWSLIAVVALTAGYEAIREVSRRYGERVAENAKNAPRKFTLLLLLFVLFPGGTGVRACNALLTRRLKADVERHSLLTAGNSVVSEEKKGKTVKAALYGIQVFYSFFIM